MKLKTIRKQGKRLAAQTILLRVDYNVPISFSKADKPKITEDYKIIASLPTIRFLTRYKCRIVLLTHLGDPQNDPASRQKYSTKFIADYLSKILGKKVAYVDGVTEPHVMARINQLQPGEIILLENIRFYPGEEKNDRQFAKQLAELVSDKPQNGSWPLKKTIAASYVNDAFSVSHRNHASVSMIKKFLPSYCGLLLERELENLEKVRFPQSPAVAVMGGAKVSTKIRLINNLMKRYDRILIGGAMANNFLAAQGHAVGKSLISTEDVLLAKKINNKKLVLPVDVIVNSKLDGQGKTKIKAFSDISRNEIILDIGPQTIRLFSALIRTANTIIWNGPMGKFEIDQFKYGTIGIAHMIAARSSGKAFGVVGGGETVEALKMTKMFEHVDWVSTGGGAMLAYLGGENMPGLKGLIN
jgi:3-phosphoglycerate kinase